MSGISSPCYGSTKTWSCVDQGEGGFNFKGSRGYLSAYRDQEGFPEAGLVRGTGLREHEQPARSSGKIGVSLEA